MDLGMGEWRQSSIRRAGCSRYFMLDNGKELLDCS
jgi:hypothetical protein